MKTKDHELQKEIEIHTFIQTFNKLVIPKVKIGWWCLKRVEQYIPAPLRCFKCNKYRHHKKDVRHVESVAKGT